MIQNPNEIAARQRMEEAMSRIEANVRTRLQMNRRQFVCGSAATMALAMLGLAGCSPKADANGGVGSQAYKAGTYEASAEGRNGAVNVKVTFTDDAIDAIDVEHEESRNIGDAAIDILKDKYLQSQSLNFDTVTGASLSSMAFATAVAECVDQAGGDVKALKKADTGIEPAAAIDEDCDVCVVGSGGAAFAAAVTAAEAGKTVVMLEKMDIYGGNTNAGEGTLNAPDPERQEPLGIEDSPDLFYQQTFEGGDELGDPALVRILADNALDAVHWMEDHGLVYEKEPFTAIGGLWQRGHAVEVEKKGEQGGSYYVSCLKDSADKTGKVTLYTDAKVEQLVEEGGKVTVRVPRGYAADYVLSTTSGDIRLYAIDVDKVKVNTTSGDVRVEPDAGIRAKEIDVTTISGGATVSACAGDVVVSTVSGKQFVSCDANRTDLNVVSGKIHAEGASEEWEISSVSGDAEVLCTVAPTRKIQINSMSASVHVALPGDIRGFVADISSMSGKIVNEFGPNRYGTCALPIHMDTMSGKLMLTRL